MAHGRATAGSIRRKGSSALGPSYSGTGSGLERPILWICFARTRADLSHANPNFGGCCLPCPTAWLLVGPRKVVTFGDGSQGQRRPDESEGAPSGVVLHDCHPDRRAIYWWLLSEDGCLDAISSPHVFHRLFGPSCAGSEARGWALRRARQRIVTKNRDYTH